MKVAPLPTFRLGASTGGDKLQTGQGLAGMCEPAARHTVLGRNVGAQIVSLASLAPGPASAI